MNASAWMIRHQLGNVAAMGWAAIRNANPITRPRKQPPVPVVKMQDLPAFDAKLVDAYAAWSGAPADRYTQSVPAHFCCHWAMPLLAQLGSLAPYNVLSLLNQGVRLEVFKPMQRGQSHRLQGTLMDVVNEGHRVRIHTRIEARTVTGAEVMRIDSYSTVPQKGSKPPKRTPESSDELAYECVGHWQVEVPDALAFAFLTGDFNPIHTVPAVGRRTRFKSLILHGFGQLARTYETLQNAGYTIQTLDVRWIKPLTMPNYNLSVMLSQLPDDEGWHHLQLKAEDGGLHMVGRVHFEQNNLKGGV